MTTYRNRRRGQIGVVRTTGFVAWLIRVFTHSHYNHAYLYLTDDYILEAERTGAIVSRASKYRNHEKIESDWRLWQADQQYLASEGNALIGTPYGFLDIVAIGLTLIAVRLGLVKRDAHGTYSHLGWFLSALLRRVEREDRLICSQLVDRVYHNVGRDLYDDGRPDGLVTPDDLARYIAEGRTPRGL